MQTGGGGCVVLLKLSLTFLFKLSKRNVSPTTYRDFWAGRPFADQAILSKEFELDCPRNLGVSERGIILQSRAQDDSLRE